MPASEDYGPLSALQQYLDYRPLGNDPWTNTMRGTAPAPGQGFATTADPVLYPTASPLVNITEGDIKRATDVGLAASGGGLKGQQIKAYHSSPHDFDRFDLSKIGTGEGAQMYGHGLYFAENPAVSGQGGQYWNQFLRRFSGDEKAVAESLKFANFDRGVAAEKLQRATDALQRRIEPGGIFDKPHMADAAERTRQLVEAERRQLALLQSGKPVGPRTYEVDINADPAHMLNWDKPFMDQHAVVQDALRRSGIHPETPGPMGTKTMTNLPTGPMAERALRDPKSLLNRNLDKAGIPGVKYLDEGSRSLPSANQFRVGQPYSYRDTFSKPDQGWYVTSQPGGSFYREYGPLKSEAEAHALRASEPWKTSNYVIRDPSILDIRKKYGLAGLLPTAVGAGAAAAEWFPPNPPSQK